VARTRAQRRRHTLLIAFAVLATLLILAFARDVSRAAHGATTARRSENRSFGALANSLLTNENNFDGRLERLLSAGGALRRPVMQARLDQLYDELPGWATAADELRRPKLAHDVNDALAEITLERVAAYETLLGDVARALKLPWTGQSARIIADPALSLLATSRLWNVDRFSLAKEPGGVHLDATSVVSASYYRASGASVLTSSPSLRLVRAIGIAAVRVYPAPLPAPVGEWLLPPVTSVQLGVSVVNVSYDVQPVTLIIQVTPLNARGNAFSQRMSATLGPLGAYAFVPQLLTTAASERARVVLRVVGARAARGMVSIEAFRLEMSPSGNA